MHFAYSEFESYKINWYILPLLYVTLTYTRVNYFLSCKFHIVTLFLQVEITK
jgi:hypothetical protein